jgi:hypothetical protein
MELALLTFLALCWAALGTGAVARLLAGRWRGGHCPDLDEAWRRYAWSKHFRFCPATRPASSPRVEARIGDVELTIETCTLRVRGASRPCTRIWGRSPVPVPARLVVSSDPNLVQGPATHGLEPMALGDPFFDHALTVRASSGEAAFRLLPPALRRSLQGLLSASYRLGLILEVEGGDVSLTWLGEEKRPAMLDEACAVVARACAVPLGPEAYR